MNPELRATCTNCGIGTTTLHEGAWSHTCPDGQTNQPVTHQRTGKLDFTNTIRTITFNETITSLNTLTNAWNGWTTIQDTD